MAADFEELLARSFDEPLDAEQQASVRVHGDALEQRGDPRGVLIALEYAIRNQPERRHVLARAAGDHVLAHAKALLGPMAVLLEHRRAVELVWRSGMLHSAFVDIRRLPKQDGLAPADVVERICTAPATRTLRRLHLRPRRINDRYSILSELCDLDRRRPPLEEVVIMNEIRPSTIGRPQELDYSAGAAFDWRSEYSLVHAYPRVRLFVLDEAIVPIPYELAQTPRPRGRHPSDPGVRTLLGRQLTSAVDADQAHAITQLTELGPAAFMFVDTLLAMLEPRLPVPQADIVRALAAIGNHARLALPTLSTITGRPAHYDVATRRAAGEAIATLRELI